MPRYNVGPNDSIIGGDGADVFVVDPANLGAASILDQGGKDRLAILDTPGRTVRDFVFEDNKLVWVSFAGDTVTMNLDENGYPAIEFIDWRALDDAGNPTTNRMKVFLSDVGINQGQFVLAGTNRDDRLEAPEFRTPQAGFSQIFGNGGDDVIVGSNNHRVIVFGGAGDDDLRGLGRQSFEASGEAGDDILRGAGGGDNLEGGAGQDTATGNNGADWLFGGFGNDSLIGGRGDDNIEGGRGDDLLEGGAGRDDYKFSLDNRNEGFDVIFGFQMGVDRLFVYGNDGADFNYRYAPLLDGALITLTDVGTRIAIAAVDYDLIAADPSILFGG